MMNEMNRKEALTIFKIMFDKWNSSLTESYNLIKKLPHTHSEENNIALRKAALPTARCYSKNAVLWPTMGDGPCDNEESIADYFALFAAKNPAGKVVDIDDPRVTKIKVHYDANGVPEISVHGKYFFTMNDPNLDRRVEVACRFGFDIVKEGGSWKWSGHNSDVLPSSQLEVKMTPVRNDPVGEKPKPHTPGDR